MAFFSYTQGTQVPPPWPGDEFTVFVHCPLSSENELEKVHCPNLCPLSTVHCPSLSNFLSTVHCPLSTVQFFVHWPLSNLLSTVHCPAILSWSGGGGVLVYPAYTKKRRQKKDTPFFWGNFFFFEFSEKMLNFFSMNSVVKNFRNFFQWIRQ